LNPNQQAIPKQN